MDVEFEALRLKYEAERPFLEPCQRMKPETVAALDTLITSTRPKIKLMVCRSKYAAGYRYNTLSTWFAGHPRLELYVRRRGPIYDIWLALQEIAEYETGDSPWWGKHRRRTIPYTGHLERP